MFGIGEAEFAIIVIFGFLLFGPDRLPGMGRTIGRALRQFRTAQEGLTKVVQTEIVDPMNAVVEGESEPSIEDELDAADSDEDIDEETLKARPKKETFAERKARLEAERKTARDSEEGTDATDSDESSDEDTESDDPSVGYVPNRLAVDSDDDVIEDEIKEEDITSARDLYAHTKKRTRAKKVSTKKSREEEESTQE